MARRFLSKLTRTLTAEWVPAPGSGVHFHGGAHGRPVPVPRPPLHLAPLDVPEQR